MMFRLYELTRRQTAMFVAAAVVLMIAVAAAVYSCRFNHTYPKELTAIDSLCESRPDSAMSLLEGMPKRVMEDEADGMYYSLLKIKAANNLYMVQKDSTIFHIVDYFEDSGDKDKLRDSYYFLGKYYVEHNDAPQALKCFQTALDIADDKTPLSFKSKVYSQSGTLFLYQNLYDDALHMYGKSFRCDSVLRDTVNMIHNIRDLAQVYKYTGNNEKCISLLKQAYTLATDRQYIGLQMSIAFVMATWYYENGDTRSALRILPKGMQFPDNVNAPYYCLAAQLYISEDKMDSAMYCYHKVMASDNLDSKKSVLRQFVRHYLSTGDAVRVKPYMKEYMAVSDSAEMEDVSESILKIHSLYNYSLREKELDELKLDNKVMKYVFIIIFLSLLSVTCFFVYMNERRKKKIVDYRLLCEHLEKLYAEACSRHSMDDSTEGRENENVDKSKLLEVYNLIHKRLDSKKHISGTDWNNIYSSIEDTYPGFRSRLFGAGPISDHDYKICLLVKMGLHNMDIATIMCRQPSAISMTRSKLYMKLIGKKGTAKEFDEYIKSL